MMPRLQAACGLEAQLGAGNMGQAPGIHHPAQRTAAYPSRAVLDGAAPHNLVLFRNRAGRAAQLAGALKLSGIDKDFGSKDRARSRGDPSHRRVDWHPSQIPSRYVKCCRITRAEADRARRRTAAGRAVERLQLGRHHSRDRPRRASSSDRLLAIRRLHEWGALTVRLGLPASPRKWLGLLRARPGRDPPRGRGPAPSRWPPAPDRRYQDIFGWRHAHRRALMRWGSWGVS